MLVISLAWLTGVQDKCWWEDIDGIASELFIHLP